MKSFLQKLDRKAAAWINTMDSQVQQPVVQVLTGDVFTHGTESGADTLLAAPVQAVAAQPNASPIRETAAPEIARASTRVLRTTSAVRQG